MTLLLCFEIEVDDDSLETAPMRRVDLLPAVNPVVTAVPPSVLLLA